MKHMLLLLGAAMTLMIHAAIPLRWTVETSRVQPAQFEAYHGETLALEATLQSYGKPHSTGFNEYQIYWQTNGMNDVYWSTPASCQDNVVTALFTPEMDTGANVVRGFIGCPGEDYRAAFQIRLRPSPGTTPNVIELPTNVIDFAKITIKNAPWATTSLVEDLFDRSQHPVPYVISETATYHYDGNGRIPAGDYYKATTGDGHVRYAAQVPMPKGRIVMTGDDDDPVLQYFGSVFRISSIATRISAASSMIDVGKYQVADLTFAPDVMLGLQCTFHVNILNPTPELTGVSMQPSAGYIEFTDDRRVQHTIYSMRQSGPSSYTYTDDTYDPNQGWWNEAEHTISVSFERDGDTAFGFAVFGGSPIATVEQIDMARSKLTERTGKADELGTGWGYKVYDFTNDERYWKLKTPRLNASLSAPYNPNISLINQAFGEQLPRPGDSIFGYAYGIRPYYLAGQKILSGGIPLANYQIRKDIVSTRDKYGSDACRYVDYQIGVLAADTNRTDSTANGRYAIALNATDIGIGLADKRYLWGDVSPADQHTHDYSFTLSTNFNYTSATYGSIPVHVDITYKDFNIASIVQTNYTVTVNVSYKIDYVSDVFYASTDGCYKKIPDAYATGGTNGIFSVYLTTSNSLEENTIHANRIITDVNQHLIWDPGLKCTWQIGVTNGMFYTEKVSNLDYRREEYINADR